MHGCGDPTNHCGDLDRLFILSYIGHMENTHKLTIELELTEEQLRELAKYRLVGGGARQVVDRQLTPYVKEELAKIDAVVEQAKLETRQAEIKTQIEELEVELTAIERQLQPEPEMVELWFSVDSDCNEADDIHRALASWVAWSTCPKKNVNGSYWGTTGYGTDSMVRHGDEEIIKHAWEQGLRLEPGECKSMRIPVDMLEQRD